MSDKPKLTIIHGDGTEIHPESEDELNQLMDAWQEDMMKEQVSIKDQFGVSLGTASAIQYLRTRSRYTPEKELLLITRDREGNPIPLMDVLSGRF